MKKYFLALITGASCCVSSYADDTVSSSQIVLQSLQSMDGKEYINGDVQNVLRNVNDYKLTVNLKKGQTYKLSYVCVDNGNAVDLSKCDLGKKSIKLWNKFPYQKGGKAEIVNSSVENNQLIAELKTKAGGYVEVVTSSLTNSNSFISNVFFITK